MPERNLTAERESEIYGILIGFLDAMAKSTAVNENGEKTYLDVVDFGYNNYFKNLDETARITLVEDIILYANSVVEPESLFNIKLMAGAALATRLMALRNIKPLPPFLQQSAKYVLNSQNVKSKKAAQNSDPNHQKPLSLEQRAKNILEIFTTTSPAARADEKQQLEPEIINETESDEAKINEKDLEYQDDVLNSDPKLTKEEIVAEFNNETRKRYMDVVTNAIEYCDLLFMRLNQVDIVENKNHQRQLEGMRMILNDAKKAELSIPLPILMEYADTMIALELKIDTAVSEKLEKLFVKHMPKETIADQTPVVTPEAKKGMYCAAKLVRALSRLIDMFKNFKKYFSKPEKPKTEVVTPKTEIAEEVIKNKKNLILIDFYTAMQPGTVEKLNKIKTQMSRIQHLPMS